MNNIIEIDHVFMRYPIPKRYRDFILRPFAKQKRFTALHDACLSIESSDCIALLGVNGAGKTTLLKTIGGLLYPTQGQVRVNGHDTIKSNLAARKNVGFVLNEDRSFYWRLTGKQNMEFFGALDNLMGKSLQNKIDELIEFVGLTNAGHKRVSDYSSGMRQRLAIARGLLADPEILLLDEPTKSLDPVGADDLRKLIKSEIYHGRKKTLIIATHQIHEALELCNKVCIIKQGCVAAFETVHDINTQHEGLEKFYRKVMAS